MSLTALLQAGDNEVQQLPTVLVLIPSAMVMRMQRTAEDVIIDGYSIQAVLNVREHAQAASRGRMLQPLCRRSALQQELLPACHMSYMSCFVLLSIILLFHSTILTQHFHCKPAKHRDTQNTPEQR